jgi:bis(5'-nucleosidyl)-tetraphosphatase
MNTGSKARTTAQLSAGVVVVRDKPGHCSYLLLRAYSHWDFSKGLLETGEQPIEAARREVEEETGITQLDFRWGYDYYETGPYRNGKIARYYIAATSQLQVELRISQELGRPEHDEYRWVSFEEGLELLGARVHPVLEWAHNKTGGMVTD